MHLIVKVLLIAYSLLLMETMAADIHDEHLPENSLLKILEDSTHSLPIDTVIARMQSLPWKESPGKDIQSFGLSRSAFWIWYPVIFDQSDTARHYLVVESSVIDTLDFFVKTNTGVTRYLSGDRRPFSSRPVEFHQFAIPIQQNTAEQVEFVMLRVSSYDGLHESMPVKMLTEREFTLEVYKDALVNGLYFGLILYLVILSIVLYIIFKDRSQILFIIYIIAFSFWFSILHGFADWFFWPDYPVGNLWIMISALVFSSALTLFTTNYLSLKNRYSWIDNVLKILTITMLTVSIPLIILDKYKLFFLCFLSIVLLLLVFMSLAGVLCIIKKYKAGYLYTLSWTLLYIGTALYILKIFGVAPATGFTEYSFQIGTFFQSIVLSIGVVIQLYTDQRNINRNLEHIVKERTAEITLVNEKLLILSTIDSLTNLYNRRYFLEQFELAARIQSRTGHKLSLVFMDIDYFKQFNDTYGHLQGDKCLKLVASTIQNALTRKSDFCARFGGEEFVACLPDTDKAGAIVIAERIREVIYNLKIPHSKSEVAEYLTISAGVSSSSDSKDDFFEFLLSKADESLYTAKRDGRNKVVALDIV